MIRPAPRLPARLRRLLAPRRTILLYQRIPFCWWPTRLWSFDYLGFCHGRHRSWRRCRTLCLGRRFLWTREDPP